MSITPQTIKDQEFQTKFRGYDVIEVKAYLDLIAEEFFELLEAKGRQDEEFASLRARCQELTQEKENIEAKLRESGSAVNSDEEARRTLEMEIRMLREQAAALTKQVKDAETEKSALLLAKEGRERALAEEARGLRDKLVQQQQDAAGKDKDIEGLRRRLAASDMQIGELKKDETASKHLLIAAQNFADDLRRKSEKEADEIMARARADVETFRRKSQEELARLPAEIERLHKQREEVRDELRRILQSHLEQLDFSSDFKESKPEIDAMFCAIATPDDQQIEPTVMVMDLENPDDFDQGA
jgi:DivIVA domain-containing protein